MYPWVVFLCACSNHSQSFGLGSEALKAGISAPGKVIAESLLLIDHPVKPLQTSTILVTLCYWAVKSHWFLLRDTVTVGHKRDGDRQHE